MNTHTTEDVNAYSTIKVDNNFNGVVNALSANGYKITNPTRASLVALLLSIYWEDKEFYVKLLESVPYNKNANNYTTSQQFKDNITKIVNGLR